MYKRQLVIIAVIILLFGNMFTGIGFAKEATAAERMNGNGLPLGDTKSLAGGPDRIALAELDDAYRQPSSIAQLKDGSILAADTANHVIRRIAGGHSEIYAGASLSDKRADTGLPAGGLLDGQAKLAFFNQPAGLAVNAAGDVFVADAGNHAIRKIDAAGNVTTIAGNGVQGLKDGKGGAAFFNHPQDVVVAADGTLYVADTLNHVIRRISPQGDVTTIGAASSRAVELRSGVASFAGSYKNGSLAEAQFNEPAGLALDGKGNLYVSDSGNQAIRYIDFSKGTVTTAAGPRPSASAYQPGALYADYGFADGSASAARFHSPRGLAWSKDSGLIIADALNHAVRQLKDGQVTTVAGSLSVQAGFSDGIESEALFNTPSDAAITASGKLLIADTNNSAVREWTSYSPPSSWKKGSIAVAYGNKLLASDVAPQVKHGRVMLPLRAVGELLGFTLALSDNGRIQLKKDNRTVWLTPGDRNVVIETSGSDKRVLTAEVAPYIVKNRVIAPLRLMAEIMGKDVQWAGSDKLVIIRDLKHAAESGAASTADAAYTPRFFEITALRGVSKVSFGGLLTVDAYVGMKLGEGAVLSTEAKATAELRTPDKGDAITVGSGTVLAATELRGANGINTTRLNLLAGHIFSHVATLTHSSDRFEVQTGLVTNAVRGTQFYTSVNPVTGILEVVLASGKIESAGNFSATQFTMPQSSIPTLILPAQQITLSALPPAGSFNQNVSQVNLNDLIQNASPDVIAAIIKNKAAIDEENAQYLEELKKLLATSSTNPSTPSVTNQEALDKIKNNLDQLLGNIVKDAQNQSKLSNDELTKLIEEANKKSGDSGNKLDLGTVKPMDPTAGLDPSLEAERQKALQKIQEEQKAKLEEQQKRQEQLQSQLEDIKKQYEETRKKLEEANKQAMEKAKKLAEAALQNTLSDLQQTEFQRAQQQAELLMKMLQAGQLVTNETEPVVTPVSPVVTPPATPEPPATPKVAIHYSDDASTELRAGSDNYVQSLYFTTENIDPDTMVQVKVTMQKDGEPVTGLPVQFNDSVVESNYEGSFILRKSYDENYTLAELLDRDDSLISYRSSLKDAGQYTEKTELLKVIDGDPVVLGSFTRTLTVIPDAAYAFNYEQVEFYQNVEGLWRFQSNAYGLADEAEVGYRFSFKGPDNEPVAGQGMRIYVGPHVAEGEPQHGDPVLIETNNEGSALLRLSDTGKGTAGGWDLAGRGIDISLISTLTVEGNYQMSVQLVQLNDNSSIGDPLLWSFNVYPTS
ncbi:hypothetical protein PghCCS26_45210 [Paenibacillus glycanilyticus]|uniref:Copper amine oxidase n=1 Tax=Paenibacillus glycanilyticus TaxID=126569 RepID=A0ABQ6NQM8_9BACL|nr:stalk domain-containing protein [Paenibacillus glycanilyticus]GMK47391.1 hypothetical protein PghCCS26_45210 [Paenibacillus glycanilyticus]